MANSGTIHRRLAVVAALIVVMPLAACDSINSMMTINSAPAPAARSYDCDTRGACGTFRLGAPNTDPRNSPGPSADQFRRDAPTLR